VKNFPSLFIWNLLTIISINCTDLVWFAIISSYATHVWVKQLIYLTIYQEALTAHYRPVTADTEFTSHSPYTCNTESATTALPYLKPFLSWVPSFANRWYWHVILADSLEKIIISW
jgi:hypothetical protein